MGKLSKVINSKSYNFLINIIIIISVGFILIEKFVDLNVLSYKVLLNIDLIILGLFALDFILRFIVGRFSYFFKDYGWIDFLAAIPIFTPAIKGLRLIRVLRAVRFIRILRFLRIIRVLKIFKTIMLKLRIKTF